MKASEKQKEYAKQYQKAHRQQLREKRRQQMKDPEFKKAALGYAKEWARRKQAEFKRLQKFERAVLKERNARTD